MRETFLARVSPKPRQPSLDLSDCSFQDKVSGFFVVFVATYTKTASIQGGAQINHVTTAACGAGTRFAVSSAAHLAYPGTTLDGGLTRDMGLVSIQNHLKYPTRTKVSVGPLSWCGLECSTGLYGLDGNQILTAILATASAESVIVDEHSDADLWFGNHPRHLEHRQRKIRPRRNLLDPNARDVGGL